MSTVVLSLYADGSELSGFFINVGSATLWNTEFEGTRIDSQISGCKKCEVKLGYGPGGTPFNVYVDGVLITSPTIPSSADYVTLFDEPTDAAHVVSVRLLSGTNPVASNDDFWRLTGDGTPTLGTPPDFGPRYFLSNPGIAYEAMVREAVKEGAFLRYSNQSFRFKGNPTSIVLFYRGNNVFNYGWSILIDGVRQLMATLPQPDTNFKFGLLIDGLDNSQEHDYEVQLALGENIVVDSIMLLGGTLSQTALSPRAARFIFFGDSLTWSQTGASPPLNAGRGHPAIIQDHFPNTSLTNLGISGSFILGDRSSFLPYIPNPSGWLGIIFMWGRNNLTFGSSPEDTKAAMDACLTDILSVDFTCPVYIFDIIKRDDATPDTQTAVANAAWTQACIDNGDPRLRRVEGGFDCVSPEGYVPGDHIHFLASGQAEIAVNRLLTLSPTPSGNALLGGGFWM